jgi:Protein of unknown function (DUF4089)
MTDPDLLAYVNITASLLGVPMDAGRAERVAAHLQRTAAMAALLDGAALAPHDEIAEIYSPAAFQPTENVRKQL